MGMFDYVRCEAKLPEGFEDLQQHEFQSKDLDEEGWTGTMTRHIISEEGKLLRDAGKREWVDEPGLRFGKGYPKRVTDEWAELEGFHGDVRLYTALAAGEEWRTFRSGKPYVATIYEFVELRARFSEGTLSRIDVLIDERGTKTPKEEGLGEGDNSGK